MARYGGEEFVVLLPQAAMSSYSFQSLSGESIHVTISIGVFMLIADSVERDISTLAEKFISSADAALHQAKRDGRDRVVCKVD